MDRLARRRAPIAALAGLAAAVLALAAPAPAAAQARASGLQVTIAARFCDAYTDVFGNRARNNIMESLKDLGPDTPYAAGEPVSVPKESLSPQSRCRPLPDWTFTLGRGIRTRAVAGPWGSLSIVTSPFATPVLTRPSVPLLNQAAQDTGERIEGATTIELTQEQANLAAQASRLWIQGGTPADPALFGPYPDEYGFAALRCAIDNLNGDNVEWISFPQGARHVLCFAYYVKPPPTSGTIIVRKEVDAPAGTARRDFRFTGNVSFASDRSFTVPGAPGAPGSATFYRAEVTGATPRWDFTEEVPEGWTLTAISCTSANDGSAWTTDLASARTEVRLAANDVVTCTYRNRLTPPPAGLRLSKVALGAVGTFSWEVTPAGGGEARRVSATTTEEGAEADGDPALSLPAGDYRIEEEAPARPGGRWRLREARCNGRIVEDVQPLSLTLIPGEGAACTYTNEFVPDGAIRIRKTTLGGVGTAGFVITPEDEDGVSFTQSATTTSPGEPVLARGDDTSALPLGRYVIQETTPSETSNGFWTLESIVCDGAPVGSEQGRAVVTLTRAEPQADCSYVNRFTRGPQPPTPDPDPDGGVSPSEQPLADLVLTKRARPRVARVGQRVRYAVTLTNRGPDAAQNVTGVEVNPPSRRALRVTTSKGRCSGRRPVTCRIGTVRPGERVVIRATTVFTRPGRVVNVAAVNTSTNERTLRNNRASATVRITPRPRFTG